MGIGGPRRIVSKTEAELSEEEAELSEEDKEALHRLEDVVSRAIDEDPKGPWEFYVQDRKLFAMGPHECTPSNVWEMWAKKARRDGFSVTKNAPFYLLHKRGH